MWRFAAARSEGTSHQKVGLPCQDWFECRALPNGILVAVVADGAGSASFGGLGARIAAETVLWHISSTLNSDPPDFAVMLQNAAVNARLAVFEEAGRLDVPPRELASTLLAVAVGPAGGGALQIGDGVIVVGNDTDGLGWVFWPQRGEYVNSTHFLTDEDASQFLQIEPLGKSVSDIAVMTDGLESLALDYSSRSVYEPFFRTMFRPIIQASGSMEIEWLSEALESFLMSERVASRTDDDLSLILATCRDHAHQV